MLGEAVHASELMEAIETAALGRGIAFASVGDDAELVLLGQGGQRRRVHAAMPGNADHVAVEIARDTVLANAVLGEAGLPVPRLELASSAEEAVQVARALGGRVVLQPREAQRRSHRAAGLASPHEIRAAYQRIARHSRGVVLHGAFEGEDFRVLVIGGRVMAAARCTPPAVTGDGRRRVRELVEAANERLRACGCAPIAIDESTEVVLARQGLMLESVPPEALHVPLRDEPDLDAGATVQDVTLHLHHDVASACVRAAAQIGLDIAAVELACREVSRPLAAQGGAILAVDPAPDIRIFRGSTRGDAHRIGEALLAVLFPPSTVDRA